MESIISKCFRRICCLHIFIKNIVIPEDCPTGKTIFLTFDDGPIAHEMHTQNILDLLQKYNITATFFCIGKQLEKNKLLAENIIANGHLIGNHTNTHKDVSLLPYKEISTEINKCQHIIKRLHPDTAFLFRPPRGHMGLGFLLFSLKHRCKPVLWSIDSMDSHGWSPTKIIQNLKSRNVDKKVILFHDDDDISVKALTVLIPYWIAQGFSFSKL